MSGATIRVDGQKVRALRHEKGWTQEELAAKTGCSKRTIENIESGRPALLRTLHEIAVILGVDPKDLNLLEQPNPTDRFLALVGPTSPGSVPQLPSLFVGREQELDEIRDYLHRTPAILTIQGWPGVGKTSLVAALAHDPLVVSSFP